MGEPSLIPAPGGFLCVWGSCGTLHFLTSPQKRQCFFPKFLDMFRFWSLLAVATQLRFCHTSFCSFWFMLVFTHTHTHVSFHRSWSRNGAFVGQVFQRESDKCGASHVENVCVLMFTTTLTHTHTQYIYTQRCRMWMGAAARSRGSCCWRPSCPQRSPRHERGDVVWNVYKAVRGRADRRPGRSTCTLWPEAAKKHTMVGVNITQA